MCIRDRALDWEKSVTAAALPKDGTISACYLGATVLELTGRAAESPWFQYLTDLRRELPVIQKETVMLSDQSIVRADALSADQTALIDVCKRQSLASTLWKHLPMVCFIA